VVPLEGEKMVNHGEFMGTKILIADDHGILRQGISSLIKEHSNMQVVGEANNGLAAVEKVFT
jgi:YesN/AraC family two-component response regulator